jgi:2-oxoglutarate ferredoxin oxidoreductase subunit alpha
LAEEPRVFLTVEMSSGQMVEDVRLAIGGQSPVLFYGRMGGGVPTVEEILDQVKKLALPVKG